MSRLKEVFRARAPRAFAALRRAKRQVQIEARVIRHINVFDFIRQMLPAGNSWRTELPVQRPLIHRVSPASALSENVGDYLRTRFPTECRGCSIYLDPQLWRRSEFADTARYYPEDASLKIMWDRGAADDGWYVHDRGYSRQHADALPGHPYSILVANHLASLGLGPRLYDVTTLTINGQPHTAYVFQHVVGRVPTKDEWRIGLDRLRAACTDSHLRVVSPGGFLHTDFRGPDCNGDAITDSNGRFVYVNFHNFALRRYGTYLKALARKAGAAAHFDERSLIRGGSYLYHAIPGVGLPARRDPQRRMITIAALLSEAMMTLENRIVLDVGCNIGMMAAEYLRAGAKWVHGWDRPATAVCAERVLLAIGCTRFSVTGCELDATRLLMLDLPPFLRSQLPGAVVSYLAVRGHLGWLAALKSMPWTAMIYEGHEGEDETAARRHLAELCSAAPAEVAGLRSHRDGNSTPRVLALVRRLPV
jgi:hypothetical protein